MERTHSRVRRMWFCLVKQKTAYEMRISDWSSDVCSSDLVVGRDLRNRAAGETHDDDAPFVVDAAERLREGVAAHRIEHDVDAADQLLDAVAIGRASCRERVCPYV